MGVDPHLWADELLGSPLHPAAARLFAGHPELTDEDVERAAVVGDRGHDAAMDYAEIGDALPEGGIGAHLRELAASWDAPTIYNEALLADDAVCARIEAEAEDGIDFEQAVWVLDVTIAATAFCHLLEHGRLDEEAKAIVGIALRRRLHPLVLEALDAEPDEARTLAVRRLMALFADAPV